MRILKSILFLAALLCSAAVWAQSKDTTVTFSNLGGEELIKLINQFEKIPDNPKLVN